MTNVFIINGYGVPKDVFKDENYKSYLGQVFNYIWDLVVRQAHHDKKKDVALSLSKGNNDVLIIFCGGRTDCFPPYRRTEAGEMRKYFFVLMKRNIVRDVTRSWRLLTEGRSLCLLENFLNAKGVLKKFKIKKTQTFLFHEWTRAGRVKYVAGLVLKGYKPQCVPIDFDVTANRYLPKDSIRRREEKMLKLDLWVLKDPSRRMGRLHRLYRQKIAYLRKAGGSKQVEALKVWWEKELGRLQVPNKNVIANAS